MRVKTFLKFWIACLFVIGTCFGVLDMKLDKANAEIATLKEELTFYYEYVVHLEEKIMVIENQLPK